MTSPILETTSGPIRGAVSGSVAHFLGIPFAAPPIGALRWRPPHPVVRSTAVRDGTRFGPAAPQLGKGGGLIDLFFSPIRGVSSEDCLYLNVWMPVEAARASGSRGGRPVFVWIHGGGFTVGAGSTFLYDGCRIASSMDSVIVTINYRLGALGFLDLQAADDAALPTANLGLLDQIAAVDWVRSNAQALGVDERRMVVVGESAGAMSLGCLLAAKPELAPRFILQSGAAEHVSDRHRAREVATTFLRATGRSGKDMEGLQSLSIEAVLSAQRTASLQTVTWDGTLPWQPSVDGALLTKRPLERVREGIESRSVGRAPAVVIGTNRHEWRLFAAPGLHLRFQTRAALVRRVCRRLSLDPAAAREVIALYETRPGGRRPSCFDIWTALRTDQFFWAPAIELAEAVEASGRRVYFYRFDVGLSGLGKNLGSCHGAEIPFLFGTHQHRLLRPFYGGNQPDRVGDGLRERWARFGQAGEPASPEDWPQYGAKRRTLVFAESPHVVDDPERERRRWWRSWRRSRSAATTSSS